MKFNIVTLVATLAVSGSCFAADVPKSIDDCNAILQKLNQTSEGYQISDELGSTLEKDLDKAEAACTASKFPEAVALATDLEKKITALPKK
jgi:hypothetical protein